MTRSLLVVTTVHHPDDNRIREKTIRSLESDFEITYAAREPGPSDASGLRWLPLRGGRVRRNLTAWRVAVFGNHDVVSLHDPELLPIGIVLGWIGRNVVFDVHEDIPAQIATKEWVARPLRRPLASLVTILLRLAERRVTLTLAEGSYGRVLRREHPVLANYPDVGDLPRASGAGAGAIYVGDVTEARGVLDAVVACGAAGIPLKVVGPCSDPIRRSIEETAARCSTELVLTGRLPHAEAMQHVAASAVALSPLRDIPNYRHSIPTKILEYLAVGVPVAASDLPATRELVRGLEAVELHRPGNADDLTAAVRRLEAPGVVELARRQSDLVRARYRWPAEELRRVYSAPGA